MKAENDGVVTVTLDNTFSYMTSKTVHVSLHRFPPNPFKGTMHHTSENELPRQIYVAECCFVCCSRVMESYHIVCFPVQYSFETVDVEEAVAAGGGQEEGEEA